MTSIQPSHIIVGLSGGVDSAVSAYLLKKAGHSIEAVFMKNWEGDDSVSSCSAAQDSADAAQICEILKIPFAIVNFSDHYWEKVFTYFLDEYAAGRTPNPDILCNKEIKFASFLNYAKQRGADYIATGHYARTHYFKQRVQLKKGIDANKDQSYFLHALDQAQLRQSIFPIGNLNKSCIRSLAKVLKFPNHDKKDSTGICFIGERKFKQFLNNYLPAKPGLIETLQGEIVGKHQGLMFYTIGQRQGLQIGGLKNKQELPWYVLHKDLSRNVLVVVQGNHPELYRESLTAVKCHWIAQQEPNTQLFAKTRYRQNDQACNIHKINETTYQVQFKQPQRAITPGQFIVFYDGDQCLGGGIIKH